MLLHIIAASTIQRVFKSRFKGVVNHPNSLTVFMTGGPPRAPRGRSSLPKSQNQKASRRSGHGPPPNEEKFGLHTNSEQEGRRWIWNWDYVRKTSPTPATANSKWVPSFSFPMAIQMARPTATIESAIAIVGPNASTGFPTLGDQTKYLLEIPVTI